MRISLISGRFLVFDSEDAALLRRRDHVNGTLAGTTPQQPSQNIFLGLPIELRSEEADALIQQGKAVVYDSSAAHLLALSRQDADSRRAYLESLRKSKQAAQQAVMDSSYRKAFEAPNRAVRSMSPAGEPASDEIQCRQLNAPHRQMSNFVNIQGITPVSSGKLVPIEIGDQMRVSKDKGSLCQHLQCRGFYMTPGLRFGARYSVYPGDPLRFHAHFMANQYGWVDEIPILDVVSGGRLATAVKKAFLMGGQQPISVSLPPHVRTFTIEWAAM